MSEIELKKFLSITRKGKLSWTGDFGSMKVFLNDILKVKGQWSSGGESEALESDEVLSRWYGSKQSLTVSGPSAEEIKAKFVELLNNGPENIVADDSVANASCLNKLGHDSVLSTEDVADTNQKSIETSIAESSRKFSLLESSVNERVNALQSEFQNFQGSSMSCRYDKEYVATLKKSNNDLKDENKALIEKVADLSYLLSDLRREIGHVEKKGKVSSQQ